MTQIYYTPIAEYHVAPRVGFIGVMRHWERHLMGTFTLSRKAMLFARVIFALASLQSLYALFRRLKRGPHHYEQMLRERTR